MPVNLNISATETQVLTALAEHFMTIGNEAITASGRFSVSLSGGSSPKKLYELLASNYADKLDWNFVYFFFGDERNVPLDHKDSNYLMAKTALFEPLEIKPENIFPLQTNLEPEQAAAAYNESICNFFYGDEVVFDLNLLGLGDNSHTASLFPHTSVLQDESVAIRALYIDEVGMYRITMTAQMINQSNHIAFLVYGAGKAEAVKHILEDERNIELYPAQLIQSDGDITWFMDEAAASALQNK